MDLGTAASTLPTGNSGTGDSPRTTKAKKQKAVNKQSAAGKQGAKGKVEEPEVDEEAEAQSYREARLAAVNAVGREAAYPHKFPVTCRLNEYVEKYVKIEDGARLPDVVECVAGRVMRLAGSSNKLRFYDLVGDDVKIQVFADAQTYGEGEDFLEDQNRIRRGDILGVRGFPGRSKRGELSIFPLKIAVLSPCLYMLPKAHYGLKDQEIRYRRRYLDLMINPQVKKTFQLRSQVLQYLRKYFTDRAFVEVETPMMNQIPGGASARPFVTHHNDLDMTLYMRVAPELYLKQLIVGGMDRVFEIGKNFRNEGIDLTHNPEFTSIEFYQAYADYHDLMELTEHLISSMVKDLTGSYKIMYDPDNTGAENPGVETKKSEPVEIDFTPPWPRFSFVEEIEKCSGTKLPRPLDSAECVETMKAICKAEKLDWPHPPTATKLLDKLCGHFVEPRCMNPAFIKDHPQIMSPLAKWHRSSPDAAERCELFVMGRELANFYTELNDPQTQRRCFEEQAKDKAAGDDEAQFMDEGYCVALEHGLPPTGGWGLGVDRLVMFLTNNANIKEVILFPAMRPSVKDQPKRTGLGAGTALAGVAPAAPTGAAPF
ncbi:lysine-tRNA ligase [Gregarina niphandrodes]|uniref:Lysine--tRNA ligase n=1 Tax=Gregarina niphandrodes TaxID=110365 RepID=A0A023B0D8_GRENI|nr:lysine-tRNA ligase [Gregarina niphandrodes]EZG45152.1 lysine-tRNA ligase [Gregarina niphandrodes]|eukprot:XP_011132543.1 lysine-tRNA ligase [Gregarina niphandrodes]